MAVAAVSYKTFRFGKSVLNVFGVIHGKYRRQFFVREFLGRINAFHLSYKHLCSLGNFDAGKFRDP